MRASNVIYEREEGRPFYVLRPLQIAVTLVLVLMAALVVLSLVVTGPVASAIGGAVGLGDAAVTAWNIAKWPVMLVVVTVMLAVLYWPSPNAKSAGFRWVSPGSILAVVVWIVASAAFAFYVANFGSYNKTYGALGGVICFLVWMWITNVAVVLGAELNAETERAREIEAGVPGAEEDIKAPYRREPEAVEN
jgi:membrane protein